MSRGGSAGKSGGATLDDLDRWLRAHRPQRIAEGEAEQRAAVALLLRRPPDGGDRIEEMAALFIERAEAEDDPWSGHVGLPGGRREPEDRSLAATARRETREETGLRFRGRDILGRLSDLHPRSPHLPSVAITPYVARYEGDEEVRPGAEVRGHLWVPVRELWTPENRSRLTLERSGERREFPAIEVEGRTIWGLTHEIVRRFLSLLEE